VLTIAALAAPGAAAAHAQTVSLPPGDPVLRATGTADGSVLLVRGQTTGPYSSPNGSLTVQRAAGATVTTTATRRRSLLAAFRPGAAGAADLVVLSGGRLQLLHLAPDGRLVRRWTSPADAGSEADVATDGRGRTVVVWSQAGRVRIVGSPDGRTFSAPRTVRAGGRIVDEVGWVAAAIDRGGRPVVVATRYTRTPATDVLTLDRFGRALRRTTLAVQGIPQTAETASGRIGIVVHDTGIEGEEGECVQDGRPRRVWATVLEPRGTRPHRPAELARQRAYCPDGGGPQLLAGRGGELLVVFGAIPDATRIPGVAIAWSAPGRAFAAPYPMWGGTLLSGAAIDPRDGSVVATLAAPDNSMGHGVALAGRAPGGTLSTPQPLTATGHLQALAVDAGGRTLAVTAEQPQRPVLTVR
jgi:hypothetical protein